MIFFLMLHVVDVFPSWSVVKWRMYHSTYSKLNVRKMMMEQESIPSVFVFVSFYLTFGAALGCCSAGLRIASLLVLLPEDTV